MHVGSARVDGRDSVMWSLLVVVACRGAAPAPDPTDDLPPAVDTDQDSRPDGPRETGAPVDSDAPVVPIAAWTATRTWETLRDAVEEADPGDVVWVAAGRHEGPFYRSRAWDLEIRGATGVATDVEVWVKPELPRVFELRGVGVRLTLAGLSARLGEPKLFWAADAEFDVVLDNVWMRGEQDTTSMVLASGSGRLVVRNSAFFGGVRALSVSPNPNLDGVEVEVTGSTFDGQGVRSPYDMIGLYGSNVAYLLLSHADHPQAA